MKSRVEKAGTDSKPLDESTNSLFHFVLSELRQGYDLDNATEKYSEKRRKVNALLHVPKELEKFLWYGLLICLDAFLYMFTFLPLRIVMAVGHLLLRPVCSCSLTHAERCDLLKFVTLAFAFGLMTLVDTSVIYHVVRVQSVIKLYIFFNMLEVADKLLSSVGQDILDSLAWTVNQLGLLSALPQLVISIVYVFLHAMLVLLQVTTLNVAFNSHNKALLTIMISNNFVELKSSVFKKFAKNNLFQMSCSDVRERFHYFVLLFTVVVRNMSEFSWKLEQFWVMCPDLMLVLLGEHVVDWIKHALITKFNEIPTQVYTDFKITIANDVHGARQPAAFTSTVDQVYTDFKITIANDVHGARQPLAFTSTVDQVSRRMGFVPLPLTVLLVRVVPQALPLHNWQSWFLVAAAWPWLITCKVLVSIIVTGWALDYIELYKTMQARADMLQRLQSQRKARSLPGSPRLSLVDFGDILQQGVPPSKGVTFSDVLRHMELDSSINHSPVSPVSSADDQGLERSHDRTSLSRSKSAVDLQKSREAEDTERSREQSPEKRDRDKKEKDKDKGAEDLADVDRYTLVNDDRIES